MSSFYSDASLIVIPSGYKASKVYSAVPTDGSGDLTFTRSNDTATRVGPDGLIEKVRTNQVRNSTMVGASAPSTLPTNWTLNSGGLTFTVIGTGTEDGYTYLEVNATGTASSSNARIGFDSSTQILGATGQYWTNSFYFKKVSETAAPDNYAMAIFENTSAGSLVVANVGSLPATTSLAHYSYTVLTSGGATVARVQPFVRFSLTALTSYNFTFRIAATQMETGDIATDYIPTTTAAVSVGPVANVPRLDYLNSSCPKLLLEPQRTNLVTFSEQFDNAAWIKVNTTITANAATSPDGYTNADALVENTATSLHDTYQSFISTSSTAYTFSCYIKPSTRTRAYLRSDTSAGTVRTLFDLTGSGSVVTLAHTSASISLVGNGWYRCSITFTEGTGAAGRLVFVEGAVGTAISYAGNGLTAFWLYGAQLEAGAYATSYIPTLGASVTRGADACVKTGISSLIGQTEGVLFLDFEIQTTGQDMVIMNIYNGTTPANSMYFYLTVSNILQAYVDNSGTVVIISSGVLAQGRYKAALAYKANDCSFYLNGSLVGVDVSNTIPTCNALMLENYASTPIYQEKTAVSQALLFKTRLSNSELASLTTL